MQLREQEMVAQRRQHFHGSSLAAHRPCLLALPSGAIYGKASSMPQPFAIIPCASFAAANLGIDLCLVRTDIAHPRDCKQT